MANKKGIDYQGRIFWTTTSNNLNLRVGCNAMTTLQTTQLITFLKDKNILFDNGLNDVEFLQVEQKFNLCFPPDLKIFLQTGLPISDKFPNWRKALTDTQTADIINERLEEPLSGVLFDIEHNNFWTTELWGELPNTLQQKLSIATDNLKDYPKLIPIFAHRYISGEPNENDNPIYSVYQTDIIYYGYDLASYLANEFGFALTHDFELLDKPKREIKFWCWCVENN